MLYIIAALIGYFFGINSQVARASRQGLDALFVNPTVRLLLSLGTFAGWLCILPGAYLAGTADGSGFLEGALFFGAALAGAFASGLIRIPGLTQLIAVLTFFLNVGLVKLPSTS